MADLYTVPLDTPISKLEASQAFKGLTNKERLYCHYLSRAAWEGGYICLLQTSPESVPLFLLLQELFNRQSVSSLRAVVKDSFTDEEFKGFLVYACAVFTNMGNYKSFGDTKFIPSIGKDKLHSLLTASELGKTDPDLLSRLWGSCVDTIYSLGSREKQLGLGEQGITTYYSQNCAQCDAEFVQKFMQEKDISPFNTRLFKTTTDGGTAQYELRMASAAPVTDKPVDDADTVHGLLGSHQFEGSTIAVTRGDYSPLMKSMVDNLKMAQKYASNAHEVSMLEGYIRSFSYGSVDDHKEGSRHWIKNRGPVVETYIGFIESYRDPFGVRGEFEGFVAVVNKEMSAKFTNLVMSAEGLLKELPWKPEYEKDSFLRPDFTSLDIVTFASSGIPAGINIPNYDDIRQNEGFKNVSLGNVLSAAYQDKAVSFISDQHQEKFAKYRGPSFEVQVGLHELLGHGSGKLFQQNEDGTFNFDVTNLKHPFTGEKISSWYTPGETWDSKFQAMASSYEECRAECVGLYLCLSEDVLSIFGHNGEVGRDVTYVNWLSMVRSGLLGLEYYTPEMNKWRQAHMQARYVILRVLMENTPPGCVTVQVTTGADGKPDLLVELDRTLINTAGKKAIGEFLEKIQVYKSTADVSAAEAMYNHYSSVSEENGGWVSIRDIVLARKKPRRMLVQPITMLKGEDVELKEFEASPEGIIECFTAYSKQNTQYDDTLECLWKKDKHYWN
ncbi:dipeptidyl peptidase 3-like [Halichondria panicea]|uniref:dipeptidyl peptidase 3-like n=1 Tax=Halichondria panicea TaxID=6063 RepID=UPI00312B89ED